MNVRFGFALVCAAVCGVLLTAAIPGAAEPAKRRLKPGEYNPDNESVELFDAVKAGQIEVRVLPRDVTGGKILVTNKSGTPLNIKLPDVAVGVHVLGQMGGMGGGMGGGGMNQAAGMGGMGGGGMGGGGGGGNFFNVAPERIGDLSYVSICLEHGKPDPTSGNKYEMRPLESVTTKREIPEVIRMLARGQLTQNVAQILAWNINNDMSFEELAAKRVERLGFGSEPYFTPDEIRAAILARQFIAQQLEAKEKESLEPKLPKL